MKNEQSIILTYEIVIHLFKKSGQRYLGMDILVNQQLSTLNHQLSTIMSSRPDSNWCRIRPGELALPIRLWRTQDQKKAGILTHTGS